MNAAVNFMPQLLYPQEKRFVIYGLEAEYAKLPPLTCGGQEMPDSICPDCRLVTTQTQLSRN